MMGDRRTDQGALFYEFSLDRHVPPDHLLRGIDRLVSLDEVRTHLAPFYSATGRPSVDPELLVRMLIVGYCLGIRSERRLCEEVHLNLAYRWFCRLGLDGCVPDHSTFSKNRHGRFRDSDLLRHLFERIVARCIEEGLVRGEGFAVDASIIRADASALNRVDGKAGLPSDTASRAVDEYLAALDDAAFGAATPVVPKHLSPTDPAARWTAAQAGPGMFAYCNNYLIDLKHAVIVDVEPSTAVRQGEITAARTMIERTEDRFGLRPERLAADTAYGTADTLNWLVNERHIAPHIPVFDKSTRTDGTFSRADFRYDQEQDIYICPGGKRLTTTGTLVNGGATFLYHARNPDCAACVLKPQCCPNTINRKISRSMYEPARDVAREIAKTDAYITSRRERKKVEMLFAHLKRILKLDRLRLRGPCGVRDEFLLAATALNLRKLAKLVPVIRPMPV
jgi:transposase